MRIDGSLTDVEFESPGESFAIGCKTACMEITAVNLLDFVVSQGVDHFGVAVG